MRHSHSPSQLRSLSLAALVVAAVAALILPSVLAPAARADAGGQVQGMVVSGLGQTESPSTAMSRLHSDGVNTVSLFVWWWTDGPTATTVRPYDGTESDAALSAQISSARANGERVILTPVIYCGSCEGGFRGVMSPSDLPTFFASYRSFIDHYAQLAQQDGVWLLFAGSEMTDLEGQTAQWEAVLSSVRQYYSGQVGYEQNWDVVAHPQFLGDVDVVGVSAYFPLDDAADPSVDQLVSDWSNSHASAYSGRNWVGDLTHLANITGKPILFGEAGYMSTQYAARQPFLNAFYSSDPQLQANLYQALLQTFSSYSWWMGVSWWEWSDNPNDSGRTPLGQPAESLLAKWYGQGWRPGASTGSSGTGVGVPGPGAGAAGTGAASGAAPAPSSGSGATSTTAGAPASGTGPLGGASGPSVGNTGSGAVNGAPLPGSSSAASGAGAGGTGGANTVASPGTSTGNTVLPGAPLAADLGGRVVATTGTGSARHGAFDALAVLAALMLALSWSAALRTLTALPALGAMRARRRQAVRRAASLPPRRGPRHGYRVPASVSTTTLPTARR